MNRPIEAKILEEGKLMATLDYVLRQAAERVEEEEKQEVLRRRVCNHKNMELRECGACHTQYCNLCRSFEHPVCPRRNAT